MIEEAQRPAHSPLGASSAERWMNCPGSVALIKSLGIVEDSDEPDYRANGVAAHELAAACLQSGQDAWEFVGEKFGNEIEVEQVMADAVQIYLDTVRSLITPEAKVFIEFGISSPVHPLYYGTVDCGIVNGTVLEVNDYKHGEGVIVEAEYNPQIMYYAYGLLMHFPEVETVNMRIIQPRGWHPEGAVRLWSVTAEYIRQWVENELVPAMIRTETDDHLEAGEHCRFCPAKLVCPLMESLWGAMCRMNPAIIPELSNEKLGRDYQMVKAVEQRLKALKDETKTRLLRSIDVPGTKLVVAKANRVWKSGADKLALKKFGNEVMTEPTLRSPADLEKELGAQGVQFTKEYAYTPQNGYSVALESDKKPRVIIPTTGDTFAEGLTNLIGGE